MYGRLSDLKFGSDFFSFESEDVADLRESISSVTSIGFFVMRMFNANLNSFLNASYGVICNMDMHAHCNDWIEFQLKIHDSTITFESIDTFRTFHKNSNTPINIATDKPAAKTKKTPPTLSMPSSGVSVAPWMFSSQLPIRLSAKWIQVIDQINCFRAPW